MPIEQSREPKQFADFELAGWENNIAGYNAALGVVAAQTVEAMLDAARVTSGSRVLDVCSGPGMLAGGASKRGADATGLDFSAQAVELARRLVPKAHFKQGNAQSLPFPDAHFDSVLCGYGVMHLPDPGAALREMLRVLRSGGRVTLSVWDATGVGLTLVYEAIRARGKMDLALPHGPDFFQFGTPERMVAALTEVGFTDPAACSFCQDWRLGQCGPLHRVHPFRHCSNASCASLPIRCRCCRGPLPHRRLSQSLPDTNRRVGFANAGNYWQRNATLIYALRKFLARCGHDEGAVQRSWMHRGRAAIGTTDRVGYLLRGAAWRLRQTM